MHTFNIRLHKVQWPIRLQKHMHYGMAQVTLQCVWSNITSVDTMNNNTVCVGLKACIFFFGVIISKTKKIKVELYWCLNLTCSQAYTEQWRCYPSPLPPVIIFWQQQAGSVAVVGGGCCSGCRTGAPWCSAVIVRWPWGETWVHTEQSASMQ